MESRAKPPASLGSRRKDATSGSDWNLSFNAPCSSQNCARQAKYSATVTSKSVRELIARLRRLQGFDGPKRWVDRGAALQVFEKQPH